MISSDTAATLFFLWAVLALWWLMHAITPARILVAGVAAGGLALSKFSAPLLVIMAVLLLILRCLGPGSIPVGFSVVSPRFRLRPQSLGAPLVLIVSLCVSVLIAWGLIWSFYDFRFQESSSSLPQIEHHQVEWESLASNPGFSTNCILFAREHHLLPDAYLYGQLFVLQGAKERPAFWDGDYSLTGWPMFFPYAFAVKTPIPMLLLLIVALLAWAARFVVHVRKHKIDPTHAWLHRTAPLWVLMAVYWIAAILSHINIGHRHILPIYPPLFILAGAAAWWIAPSAGQPNVLKKWQGGTVLLLLLLTVADTLFFWPNYLAYYNQSLGDPRDAYRHLVDSSTDWGQDLPALKVWLDRHKLSADQPVYFSYFGSDIPERFGLHLKMLPSVPDLRIPTDPPQPLQPGVYIVSATMLQSIYSPFPGVWTHSHEEAYQQSIRTSRRFPGDLTHFHDENGPGYWPGEYMKFGAARFSRLAAWLRNREPDDVINSSLLVYKLTADDLKAALEGPAPEWGQMNEPQ
jgi:hypothetical protein